MAYKSRMNGLDLNASSAPCGGAVDLVTKVDLGARAAAKRPSNNPGPMTSPSPQGAERPRTQASKTTPVNVPKR